jgi:Glycosyl transferase family 2
MVRTPGPTVPDPPLGPVAPAPAERWAEPATSGKLVVMLHQFGTRPYLRAAVDSVLRQSLDRSRFQIFLVKNLRESEDRRYRDGGLELLYDERPELGAWVDRVLECTDADVYAFLDDDDVWAPTKLAWVAREFAQHPSLAFLHHEARRVDGAGRPVPSTAPRPGSSAPRLAWRVPPGRRSPEAIARLWHDGAAFNLSSMAVRRSVLLTCRPTLSEVRHAVSLLLFCAALLGRGSIECDPEERSDFRVHDGNTSPTAQRAPRTIWRKEAGRAGVRAADCARMLEWIRARGGLPWMEREIESARRRAVLVLAMDARPPTRGAVLAATAALAVEPRTWRGGTDLAYLRMGVRAALGLHPGLVPAEGP